MPSNDYDIAKSIGNLEGRFKEFSDAQERHNDNFYNKLELILTEVRKTNGRVTVLEPKVDEALEHGRSWAKVSNGAKYLVAGAAGLATLAGVVGGKVALALSEVISRTFGAP